MLYKWLVFLRFLCIFLPSYIHPDEHFQSVEVTAHSIFGFKAYIPWEYKPEYPCRSVAIPFVATGFPLYILKLIDAVVSPIGCGVISTATLLYFPRFFLFLLSLIIDYSYVSISKHFSLAVFPGLLYVASSWAILVFHTRPFSNSVESIVLALTLCVALRRSQNVSFTRAFLLGILFSVGIFTRFTYVFFAFPIGLYLLYLNDRGYSRYPKLTRLGYAVGLALPVMSGFILASFLLVICDSLFFGHVEVISYFPLMFKGPPVIAPLNNFIYNLDPENLRVHGIHPRYTHIGLNLPLLVGPLALNALVEFFSFLALYTRDIQPKRRRTKKGELPEAESFTVGGCIVSGLLFLSIAPHQEARFLLPLVFPLILVLRDTLQDKPKYFMVWLVFNLLVGGFFGGFHQGGVVRALSYVQERIVPDIRNGGEFVSVDVVFRHTYMPPRSFLAIPAEADNVRVHDIGNLDVHTFLKELTADQLTDGFFRKIFLVCPEDLENELILDQNCESLNLAKQIWPHFSSEFPPDSIFTGLNLNVYKYRNDCHPLAPGYEYEEQ